MTIKQQRKRVTREPRVDWDGAWKEAIQQLFGPFLELLFPELFALVDWAIPPVFLEQEFRLIRRRAKIGKRSVDKLARVQTVDGLLRTLLIHMEFQNQVDEDIEERLYTYNTSISLILQEQVVTVAVLGDSDSDWKPDTYSFATGGFNVCMRFPIAKLLDYSSQWDMLEASTNPFAVVVMAHLKSLETYGQPETRFEWKLRIAESLYAQTGSHSKEKIEQLILFIDLLMPQTEQYETTYVARVHELEEQQTVKTLAPMQKLFIKQGRQEGRQEGMLEGRQEGMLEGRQEGMHLLLLAQIAARFGEVPEEIEVKVQGLSVDAAREVAIKLITATSLADLGL